MAESKGSLIAKSVQKHAGRAKEKVGFGPKTSFLCWRPESSVSCQHVGSAVMLPGESG